MGSGTYKGELVEVLDVYGRLEIHLKNSYGEVENWPVVKPKLVKRIIEETEIGDLIEVEVEFETYTVTGFTLSELNPRALLVRIQELESRLAQLTENP